MYVAAKSDHEAREDDGLLGGSAFAIWHDEEAVEKCWYDNVEEHIKYLSRSACNESSKAQQRTHPGYSKLETRSFHRPNWRDVTIVSCIPQYARYIYSASLHL